MQLLVGATALIVAVSAASNYTPIQGFNENRQNFYRHEKHQVHLNKEIATYTSDNLRIGHFDSHWHGMSSDEYLSLFRETGADVLVARGMPEREGFAEVVKGRLVAAGLDRSTIVESPCAALTSGLAIGVRNGVTIEESSFLSLDGTYVALEATLKVQKTTLKLLVITVEALDPRNRLYQLNFIERRVKELYDQGFKLIVLGGFHNNVKESPEARAIKKTAGAVTDVFSSRQTPTYTSWWGKFTDTAFVTSNLLPAIRDANVWHAPVDCLPVLVDFYRSTLATGKVPKGDGHFVAVPAGSRFDKIRRTPSWLRNLDWKMGGFIAGGALLALFIVFAAYKMLRRRGSTAKRIQATGKYTDSDLKVTKVTKKETRPYSDEKH